MLFRLGEAYINKDGRRVRPILFLPLSRPGYQLRFTLKEVRGTGWRRVLEILRIVRPRTTVVCERMPR